MGDWITDRRPTEKQVRREWWLSALTRKQFDNHADAASLNEGVIHVREVLPCDDEREVWVAELVRRCERLAGNEVGLFKGYREIREQLQERGE